MPTHHPPDDHPPRRPRQKLLFNAPVADALARLVETIRQGDDGRLAGYDEDRMLAFLDAWEQTRAETPGPFDCRYEELSLQLSYRIHRGNTYADLYELNDEKVPGQFPVSSLLGPTEASLRAWLPKAVLFVCHIRRPPG